MFSHWEIRRGQRTEDINRIILTMMMKTASRYMRPFSCYKVIKTMGHRSRSWGLNYDNPY